MLVACTKMSWFQVSTTPLSRLLRLLGPVCRAPVAMSELQGVMQVLAYSDSCDWETKMARAVRKISKMEFLCPEP